jgi:phosphoglucosamine mutase
MTKLFGTDGIRGLVGRLPITPDFFLKLGIAVGTVLKENSKGSSLVVGRDTRSSGPMLGNALVSGLLASGINVIDVDVIPTSGVAYLVRQLNAAAGAVISASHNPFDQNGIKFFDSYGYKFPRAIEIEIEDKVSQHPNLEAFNISQEKQFGRVTDARSMHELYLQALLKEHPNGFLKGLAIVIDCANGAASNLAAELFSRSGAQVISVNASPTGENINVHSGSERARRFPGDLGEIIHTTHADFGLAFDGDADRVVFVDENGSLIDGDHMLGLLAQYLDKKNQLLANAVVTTTMRNDGLNNFVKEAGLKLYETPVGDKYVVEKILELRNTHTTRDNYGLGGEQAGHIVLIDDENSTGDGMRTALFIMRAYLEAGSKSMAEFSSSLKKTPQIIASAFVGDGTRMDRSSLDELENQLLTNYPNLVRANLRYSGTEPIFRVMLESNYSITEMELAGIAWRVCRSAQEIGNARDGEIDILNCTRGGYITPE